MIERRLKKVREKGVVSVGEIDVALAVEKTEGYNGSDISALLDKAEELSALRAVETGEKKLCDDDIVRAVESTESSVQREDIERLLSWKGE